MVRVLDLSEGLAGRYGARLLADRGWQVSALRPGSDGIPELAYLDQHLGRGKRIIELDLAGPGGPGRLRALLQEFDYVVHSFRGREADRLSLTGTPAGPVVISVTPYGRTGPCAERAATDETLLADAGGTLIAGEPGMPPLISGLPIASTIGGIYTAMTALACELGSVRGWRRPLNIDIAIRDLLPANLEKVVIFYTYLQAVSLRGSGVGRVETGVGAGIFRARDGDIHIFAGPQPFSHVARLIGRPEFESDPRWTDPVQRAESADEINAIVADAVAQFKVGELMTRAEQLGMPCSRVNALTDVFTDPQAVYRQSVRSEAGHAVIREPYRFVPPLPEPAETNDPAPARVARQGNCRPAGPHPVPAQHERLTAPLEGVRVLDLTHAYAGPTVTRVLAELGAEVIKVESVNRLDIIPRGLFPADNDTSGDWWERSGYFAERNACKKGITLDMTSARGRELFLGLVATADVVAWNFRPRVMDAWGLTAERLQEVRPGLIVLAMSGFGQTGPDAGRSALASTMEAASGLTSVLTYRAGEVPTSLGFAFGDMVAGLYGALAVLMALQRRDSDGTGSYVDLACYEGPLAFLALPLEAIARGDEEGAARGGRHALIRCGAATEQWALVHVADEAARHALCSALELADLPAPPEAAVTDLYRDDVTAIARSLGLAAAPLLDGEELLFDEGLRSRGVFEVLDRPDVGPRPHPRLFPILADGAGMGLALRPPPQLGQHNDEVLGGLLGLTGQELAELTAHQVIGTRPRGGLPRPFSMPLSLGELERQGRIRRIPDASQRWQRAFGVAGAAGLAGEGARSL